MYSLYRIKHLMLDANTVTKKYCLGLPSFIRHFSSLD